MALNQLYIEFRLKPATQELAETLIRNGAQPSGDCARMLDELLSREEKVDVGE